METKENNNVYIYLDYDNFKNLVRGFTEKFENKDTKTTVSICLKDIGFYNMIKIIEQTLLEISVKREPLKRSITIDGVDISVID